MRQLRDGLAWLSLWGLAAATAAFSIISLARQLDLPDKKWWTDSVGWTSPLLLTLGVIVAVGGPAKLIQLHEATKQSDVERRARDLCQQILGTMHQSLLSVPIETFTVHTWKVARASRWRGSDERLDRLASFRVELRPNSGVVWTKGKGAVGECWATNLEIEADLSGLHKAVAEGGKAAFPTPSEATFNLSWDEYQKTKRYTSIFVTPLRDLKGDFMGCVSIDTTANGHHSDFVAACTRSDTTGLVGLMSKLLLER